MTPEVSIIDYDGVTLVRGPDGGVPADLFLSLASRFPQQAAVFDPDVARMAEALFAIGTPDNLARLRGKLAPEARTRINNMPRMSHLSAAAREWLACGEQGLSALAIYLHTTGVRPPYLADSALTAYPRGPADLRRCRLLLDAVPEVRARFAVMATVSGIWRRYVDAWPQLCATMDAELPQWRAGGGIATRTSQAMQALQGATE